MRKLLVLTVVVIGLFGGTNTAQGHLAYEAKGESLKHRLEAQTKNLKHAKFVCKHGAGHHKRWACEARAWITRERGETLRSLLYLYRPPRYSAWLCIHSHEGAWNSNTGNGYYGGLQMDYDFMSAYGGHLLRTKGTADKWTPLEQMQVAERAYRSGRGFYPWPNTARMCGLI